MAWVVYILECADGTLYTGITNDIERRIQKHEEGSGAKYTRGRGPFCVAYQQEHDTRSSATKREIEIKKMSREEKKNLITDPA